jgi:hypothetical protein
MRLNKFWLSATVLNIAVLSGASLMPAFAGQSEPISKMYGSWTMSYDWACSGNATNTPMTLESNGTFKLPSQSSSGTWAFAGDSIILKFPSGTTYSGIAYSRTMKGRSTTFNNLYGCWTANKTSTTSTTSSQPSQQTSPSRISAEGKPY